MRLKGIWLYVILLGSLPVPSLSGQDCAGEIKRARAFIEQSDYNAALPLLNNCLLDERLSDGLRVEANLLLAKTGVALGDREGAIAAFKELLRISPLYELDQNEDQETLEIFNQARFEFFSGEDSEAADSSKDWPWILAASSVMATLVALMF